MDAYLDRISQGGNSNFLASLATSIVFITITIFLTASSSSSGKSQPSSKHSNNHEPGASSSRELVEKDFDDDSKQILTVPGIYNEGNTCFMNSVIQSVSSLTAFPIFLQSRLLFLHKESLAASAPNSSSLTALKSSRYFSFFSPFATSSGEEKDGSSTNPTAITEALHQITEDLGVRRDGLTLSKSHLVKALAAEGELEHLYGYHQQDAHEFFVHLSSKITEEDGKLARIPNLFDSSVIRQLHASDPPETYGLYGNRPIHWRPSKMKRNPFMGLTVNVIICQACGHRPPSQHEVFYNLSITVPTHQHPSILSMLNCYTSPETIDEYLCGKCTIMATKKTIQVKIEQTRLLKGISSAPNLDGPIKKELSKLERSLKIIEDAIKIHSFDTDNLKLPQGVELVKIMSVASKRITLAAAPLCLCIHLQRSIYLPETGHTLKNNASVSFEEVLDLNSFFLPNATKSVARSDFAETFLALQKHLDEQRPLSKALGTTGSATEPPGETGKVPQTIPKTKHSESIAPQIVVGGDGGPFVYQLASAILHYGHHDSGHFVTLRRVVVGRDVIWFRVSDANVERIADVSNDIFLHGGKYVYMLFYERQ